LFYFSSQIVIRSSQEIFQQSIFFLHSFQVTEKSRSAFYPKLKIFEEKFGILWEKKVLINYGPFHDGVKQSADLQ